MLLMLYKNYDHIAKHMHFVPFDSQQSTEGEKPRETGQLLVPQKSSLWQSSLVSQSPSSMLQGSSDVQKFSFPFRAWWQQKVLESKPKDSGHVFDPHLRPSWHWWLSAQSPSVSEQVLQAQNPMSPLLTVVQLTENEFTFE